MAVNHPPNASFASQLARVADTLTPSERRLAELIIDEPTSVAFATVADLADRIDTSGPTVVRFATKLGFAGYSALQQQIRTEMAQHLQRPTDRIHIESSTGDEHRAALATIDSTFQLATPERINAMAGAVEAATGYVWIVTSETSSPIGQLLASNLSLVRQGVRLVTASATSTALAVLDASPSDVTIVIDVARYEQWVLDTARALHEAGSSVVAITDGPLSPLATIAHHWCPAAVHAVGPFDSTVGIVVVAELLVAAVAELRRAEVAERLERSEQAWADRHVFADTQR